ncbi:MAG: dTDP-4-amino-4,6-dideoxygalactose transaminase [Coriobacteriales bacterium]|jgi:dTDP-4-amino-4,6-dideoxygalactose transaminase|nr:dTDP-4-amino-4,6-dideoxygalactose transaminase [Coriobacteriales bacterium]
MIPFNQPSIGDKERQYVLDSLNSGELSGDGKYTFAVYDRFKELFGIDTMRLTTSGSSALELAALLTDIGPGDEFIVPSYTFSSTVNAFLLRGATPVFCDIRPDTLNIDETKIEALITPRTKVIVPIDYAGVPAEMDTINALAATHGLQVVEDAAQSVGSTYKGRPSGLLCDLSCFSFHVTKNYAMGEGGALVMAPGYLDRADIIREKGTNRRQMLDGKVDKYTWQDIGSSYLPSDLLAALLLAQMERFQEIMDKRLAVWDYYFEALGDLAQSGDIQLPTVPAHIQHNAHMFYLICADATTREELCAKLNQQGIKAASHYVPLHTAPFGQKNGWDKYQLPVTDDLSVRLLRLPLYADMSEADVQSVIDAIHRFYV